MAKVNKGEKKAAPTDLLEGDAHQDNLEAGQELGFGKKSTKLSAQAEDVDPFLKPPSVMPGKPGFDTGDTICGIYVATKRVYSEKFTAGKVHDKDGSANSGKKYRDLHMMKDADSGVEFTIFSVGQLTAVFKVLQPGAYIEITNEGKAAKALKAGQSPGYEFSFKGVNEDGSKLVIDWNKVNAPEAQTPPPAAAVNTAAGSTMTQ